MKEPSTSHRAAQTAECFMPVKISGTLLTKSAEQDPAQTKGCQASFFSQM